MDVAATRVPSTPEPRRATSYDRSRKAVAAGCLKWSGRARGMPQRQAALNMTHLCCHHCRVRFTADAATYLIACPECERPTARVEEAHVLLGFRLFDPLDLTDLVADMPEASPAKPRPRGTRS